MTDQELRDELRIIVQLIGEDGVELGHVVSELVNVVRQAQLTILDQVRIQESKQWRWSEKYLEGYNRCATDHNQRIDHLQTILKGEQE